MQTIWQALTLSSWMALQVFEAATDAGADDIQPAIVEDVQIGFKVLMRQWGGLCDSFQCVPDLVYHMQVLTAVEDFAVVRAELSSYNLPIDEDQSGLVYVPLAAKEVCLGGNIGILLLSDSFRLTALQYSGR